MQNPQIKPHIILDKKGVPIITGTNMKVIELVLEKSAFGWSPEELHFQHPYLSLGQIHSALAYYWDHQKALDADIEKRLATVDKIQQKMAPQIHKPDELVNAVIFLPLK